MTQSNLDELAGDVADAFLRTGEPETHWSFPLKPKPGGALTQEIVVTVLIRTLPGAESLTGSPPPCPLCKGSGVVS